MPHSNKLYGRGRNYIRRRCAYWMLDLTTDGWVWKQVNKGDWS